MRVSVSGAPHAAPTAGSTERSRRVCSRPRTRTGGGEGLASGRRAVTRDHCRATTSVRLCVTPPARKKRRRTTPAMTSSVSVSTHAVRDLHATATGTDSVTLSRRNRRCRHRRARIGRCTRSNAHCSSPWGARYGGDGEIAREDDDVHGDLFQRAAEGSVRRIVGSKGKRREASGRVPPGMSQGARTGRGGGGTGQRRRRRRRSAATVTVAARAGRSVTRSAAQVAQSLA